MSLEQRLSEALRSLDEYQPSVDLYSRTTRSIAEDRAHRRRVLVVTLGSIAGVVALVALFALTVDRVGDQLTVPLWAVLVARAGIMVTLLVVLGPVIRRFGRPFITGAFQLDPETGMRFSRLLDIAYFLVFGGIIVITLGIDLDAVVLLPQDLKDPHIDAIAAFALVLGIGHILNLLAIPVAGLIFSTIVRRDARHRAGAAAPPEAEAARRADRVVKLIVGIGGGLIAVQVGGLILTLVVGLFG